jgi:hypothetical protein
MSADLMIAMHPDTIPYVKFAFVRNPWDKLVSIYHDFTKRRYDQYSGNVKCDQPLLHEFQSFEDFCLKLEDSVWIHDVFFKPQITFVTLPGGKVIDYIGKFERLQDDFRTFCLVHGLATASLGHLNKGNYSHGYRKFYTSASRSAVEHIYRADIEAFDYEF